jgi:hypothetical protein
MKIIDYSWWRPDPNALRQAGITSVCRYLGYGGKVIDKAEYDALHAAGISVMLNWETTGKSWREGYNTGVNEGREARRQARALGHPDERPIIQSMDEGVPAGMLNVAADYQRGFNDGGGVGPQGAYGTQMVLDHLFDKGLIRIGWQTNARGWEGNSKDCIRASLYQRTTHSFPSLPSNQYDENDVHFADWGQHPSPNPVPPKPTKKGHEMFFLTKISDAASDNGRKAVFACNGQVYHWVTGDEQNLLVLEAQAQGLPANIGSVKKSQLGRMTLVGPDPGI